MVKSAIPKTRLRLFAAIAPNAPILPGTPSCGHLAAITAIPLIAKVVYNRRSLFAEVCRVHWVRTGEWPNSNG